MAAIKAKRSPVFRQPKFPVYEALYKLNVAFQSLAYEIERLDDYEAVSLGTLRLYRATAEELRSAINHRVTGVLLAREERDWYRYGEEVRKIEERQRS